MVTLSKVFYSIQDLLLLHMLHIEERFVTVVCGRWAPLPMSGRRCGLVLSSTPVAVVLGVFPGFL